MYTSSLCRLAADQNGSALVGFALVVPILMLILVGTIVLRYALSQ
jgi:Flp pilus assembly protein TadG